MVWKELVMQDNRGLVLHVVEIIDRQTFTNPLKSSSAWLNHHHPYVVESANLAALCGPSRIRHVTHNMELVTCNMK